MPFAVYRIDSWGAALILGRDAVQNFHAQLEAGRMRYFRIWRFAILWSDGTSGPGVDTKSESSDPSSVSSDDRTIVN